MYILYKNPAGAGFLRGCQVLTDRIIIVKLHLCKHSLLCFTLDIFYSPETCVPSAFMWYLSL